MLVEDSLSLESPEEEIQLTWEYFTSVSIPTSIVETYHA
jgi:hypothetical protein